MTGAEFVAAAGAAAAKAGTEAAKAASEETKAVRGVLLDGAEGTPAMQAAARAFGQRQAVKQEILLKLYQPLARLFGVSRAYFENDFAAEMAETMRDIPEESIQAPRGSVAGPAMQALTFALDEPDLKKLYLELLATASDSRVATSAHPSFVDALRQITAEEALLLPVYLEGRKPLVRTELHVGPDQGRLIQDKHIAETRDDDGNLVAIPYFDTYVDNWSRLGLVTCVYDNSMARESHYEWVDDHPTVAQIFELAALANENDVAFPTVDSFIGKVGRGFIDPTVYGQQFGRAVGMLPSA